MSKRVAVLLGDFFWSSIPYQGLDVLYALQLTGLDVDLLVFKNDIRLNKTRFNQEKYYFDSLRFTQINNLKTLTSWDEFAKISNDYALIITSVHIAPKTRWPGINFDGLKCPILCWDIGGADILTSSVQFARYFATKGLNWATWLNRMTNTTTAHVTGSPQYDAFLVDHQTKINITDTFCEKYGIIDRQKTILIMPSNPTSHRGQFEEGLNQLSKLVEAAELRGWQLLIKTYPGDYLFYEREKPYSGVYRRVMANDPSRPMYQMLNEKFPALIVVESQDHHAAIMTCKTMFNMSGTHAAWESFFTDITPIAFNYESQPHYGRPHYLPDYVTLPDRFFNVAGNDIDDLFKDHTLPKLAANDYFCEQNSLNNIAALVHKLI